MIDFIHRSWPSLFETDVRKVSPRDLRTFGSADINSGTLQASSTKALARCELFSVKRFGSGARFRNPAAGLSQVKIRQKRLGLPSRGEFLKFVDAIRNAGARESKDCANLVCFLAYTGLRIGDAKHVTWADVNCARHQLHVRGDPETATKNGETRFVTMISELERC